MPTYFTNIKQKNILDISKKILEFLHIKQKIYQIFIIIFQTIALNRIDKIVHNSRIDIKKPTGKKIIFYTIGRYGIMGYFEASIAKSLQIRGYDVKMLVCGGALNMCTTHFTINQPYHPWVCKNCISFSKNFFKTAELPFSSFNDYITNYRSGLMWAHDLGLVKAPFGIPFQLLKSPIYELNTTLRDVDALR